MKLRLIFASLLVAGSGAAFAQAPRAPATPPQQTAPPAPQRSSDCAPTGPHQSRGATPEGSTTGQAQEPLADKLQRSEGVLCPPAGVDPEMTAPAPDVGKTPMPVIPPPGSPGGDPNVRPK